MKKFRIDKETKDALEAQSIEEYGEDAVFEDPEWGWWE